MFKIHKVVIVNKLTCNASVAYHPPAKDGVLYESGLAQLIAPSPRSIPPAGKRWCAIDVVIKSPFWGFDVAYHPPAKVGVLLVRYQ